MTIIKTFSLQDFLEEFRNWTANNRNRSFSTPALTTLFEYYDSMDEPVEMDVVAICCDWHEYGDALEAARDRDWEEEEAREEIEEELTYNDDYEGPEDPNYQADYENLLMEHAARWLDEQIAETIVVEHPDNTESILACLL